MGRLQLSGKLDLDGSGWDKTLRTAGDGVANLSNNQLGGLKSAILQAFSIGAVIQFGKHIVENVANIKHMSEQFDATTNEVQRLQAASENTGLGFEDVAGGISKLGKARKEAAEGNREMREMFERYGISLEDLQNPAKRNIDLFMQMGHALRGVTLDSGQRQELRDMFGRGGDRLAAVISEIESAGPIEIISEEQVDRIDQLDRRYNKFKRDFDSTSGQGMGRGLMAMDQAFSEMRHPLDQTIEFMKGAGRLALLSIGIVQQVDAKPQWNPTRNHAQMEDEAGSARIAKESAAATEHQLFLDKKLEEARKQAEEAAGDLSNEIRDRNFENLTPLEKEAELRKRITAELRAAAAIEAENGGEKTNSSIDLRRKANKNQMTLDAMIRQHEPRIQTDSLNKVGNFLGQSSNSISSVHQRVIEATTRNTTSLDKVSGKLGNLTEKLDRMVDSINSGGDGGFPP